MVKAGKGERRGRLQKHEGQTTIATYNIWDGRSAGLLSAARAHDHTNVAVAAVQEVELKDPKFATRTGFRYAVHMVAAESGN